MTASQNVATYTPNEISVVISQASSNISHTISGYAEDSIVKVDRVTDDWELYVGADNTTTRVYKGSTATKVSLSLQQTASSNDVLSYIRNNDLATLNASGLFSITIKDNSGRSVYFAQQAFLMGPANSEFGNTMHHREWVICAPRTQQFIGGNSIFTPDDATVIEALGGTIPTQWAPS